MAADNLDDEEPGEWRAGGIRQLKQQAAELYGEEMISMPVAIQFKEVVPADLTIGLGDRQGLRS